MSDDSSTDDTPASLADQLADLEIDVSDGNDSPDASSPPPAPSTPDRDPDEMSDEELFRRAVNDIDSSTFQGDIQASSPTTAGRKPPSNRADNTHPPAPTQGDPSAATEPPSDEALFRQAVDDIDPSQIYDAKFRGQAAASLPDRPDEKTPPIDDPGGDATSDEARRKQVQQVRDAALFEKMVGSVTPLEGRDKYHHHDRRPAPHGEDTDSSSRPQLNTPSLPRSGEDLHHVPPLDKRQRELMARYRQFTDSEQVPEIHLRGDTRDQSLQRLPPFVRSHWERDTVLFVRIIHGRGLRSEAAPILKPTVLEWLEGAGRRYIAGYVPERLASGDYGSLIVELAPTDT